MNEKLWRPPTIRTRCLQDLDDAVRSNIHRLPRDIGLVVGVPRSGMLAASLIASYINLPLIDLDGYIRGGKGSLGLRRQSGKGSHKSVLIVDDSISTGTQNKLTRCRIEKLYRRDRVYYFSVFGTQNTKHLCDFICELVEQPRIFSWNVINSWVVEQACVDIDGLLCIDPTENQNDDSVEYKKFISNVDTLFSCKEFIGHIVTSRLEKYRERTVEWLSAKGISYGELHMMDLPDAKSRSKRGFKYHGYYKASVYRRLPDTRLFLESSSWQAKIIANLSSKIVFSAEDGRFYHPSQKSIRKSQIYYYIKYPRAFFGFLARRYSKR